MAQVVTRRMIERRKRGVFGWLFLLLFWAFNALMAWAILKGAMDVAEMGKTVDPRYRSAHDAGAGLGVMIMLVFWAAGAVVFGLLAHFTRGKRELLEVETVAGR